MNCGLLKEVSCLELQFSNLCLESWDAVCLFLQSQPALLELGNLLLEHRLRPLQVFDLHVKDLFLHLFASRLGAQHSVLAQLQEMIQGMA